MDIRKLKNEFARCECGRPHEASLRDVVIGSGITAAAGEILKKNGFGKRLLVTADENTIEAAAGIEAALFPFECKYKIFPDYRLPTMERVREVEALAESCDGILSIGTGSLNDTCRLAAARKGKPFAIFATAPSMDGFASAGAPIVEGCFKQTYAAASPVVFMADTKVLADSPACLKSAGFGDMMGKYLGLVDWKVSALVSGEYFCPRVAALTERAVARIVSLKHAITARDERAAGALTEALILTGIAMAFTGNSRPASGTEHILAHYWECKKLEKGLPLSFHGDEVGVATLEIVGLYKELVKHSRVRQTAERTDWNAVYSVYAAQKTDIERLNTPSPLTEVMPHAVENNWDEIRRLVNGLPEVGELEAIYDCAGCPKTSDRLSVDEALRKEGIAYHPYMRHRITLIRLLPMLELL